MVDKISFELKGLDSLLGKLANIKTETRYRGGRAALRKAAQVIRDAARANALTIDDPDSSEVIAKNITERWSNTTYKNTGDLKFRVGVMGGAGGRAKSEKLAGNPGGDTRHWRLVEFGTEQMRARPIMRPALENNIQEATESFISEYQKAIDRAISRLK